ncbi:hypothetical protein JTE90_028904 [Oedothorax gibbosus]|uniref:Uncharacterized protein n=1 Tax=Oedothorax gibbosus TaxID=931172 RepID=A0AAV6UNY4_9ARAC|nr:hypothetical protein JTE90_028904 [Oedothorax gibbosus]
MKKNFEKKGGLTLNDLSLFAMPAPQQAIRQKKQKEDTASSSIPSDESSAAGPSSITPQYELKEKRRFVNIAFFVKSLKDLNSHGGDGCTLSDMNISGETKNGWNAGIKLSCSVCLTAVIAWMDDPDPKLVNSQPSVPSTSATSTGTDTKKLLTAEKIPTKKRRINNQETTVQPADSPVQTGCMVQPTDPQVQQTMVPPVDSLGQTGCMVQPTDLQVQQTMVPPADSLGQTGCMVQPTDPQVQLTMMPPVDSLGQTGCMVQPTDPQVQLTMMPPVDSLGQTVLMMQPTDPQVQQTIVPPADPLVQLQFMMPLTLAGPFGPQSNASPNQGWSYNPLHLIHSQVPPALTRPILRSQINSSLQNRTLKPMYSGHPHFMLPPQLARPFVPQPSSPHQGWRHNSLRSVSQFVMQPQISTSFVPQSDSSPHQYRLYNPSHSNNPHFMVPPPLARPFLLPQSNTVHQNETDNLSHSINLHPINQTSFVKQELAEDDASSSINQVPRLSTQPACVQLFFSKEPSENSNTMPESVNESTTLTPEETLSSCQTFSTTGLENNQNLANFKNETIVPEKMPTEVLPVDLNLVKEEIEDESQSMEFSVRLVPHSEVSLNHSEAPFGSESPIKAKIATDSTSMNTESVMPSQGRRQDLWAPMQFSSGP